MKNSQLLIISLLILGLSLMITSCNKDEEEVVNDNSTVYSADAVAESLFEDVSQVSDEAYALKTTEKKSTNSVISECAIITISLTDSPYTMTIDFGSTNCLCNDGRYRRGIINVSFTGAYREQGTIITYTFDNYFVDNNQVEGTKTVTNMGLNNNGNIYYDIQVTGFIHLANNEGIITWDASKEREWIEGSETILNLSDDVYLITGSVNGIRPGGKTWTREITTPLRVEIGCRWIVSGTMEITPEDETTITLDWGDGDCDNIATVIVYGVTYTIFLP